MRRKKAQEAALTSRTNVKVRFSDVDSMQVVWHGEYVKYFEDGREEFGREYEGLGYMDYFNNGYLAPIVDIQVQYKQSLRCNDIARVETRYINTESAKICFEYIITRASDGEIVATGSSMQVFTNLEGELELNAPKFYLEWKKRWIE